MEALLEARSLSRRLPSYNLEVSVKNDAPDSTTQRFATRCAYARYPVDCEPNPQTGKQPATDDVPQTPCNHIAA